MSKVTIREWYGRVEALWAPHQPLPQLTAEEAVKAARKLYRFVYGKAFPYPIEITSGNRYNRMRRVNPDRGWHSLIHSLSHRFDQNAKPHSGSHARLEMRMIREVIKRGWLNGTLRKQPKAEKSAPDAKAIKYARTLAAIERWEAKERRAANALKKLMRSLKAQERAQITRGAMPAKATLQ